MKKIKINTSIDHDVINPTHSGDIKLKKERLDWLQGLRGIACLLVVFTHARYFLLGTSSWDFAEKWLRPGAAGVDLFFVISGFIMVLTTNSTSNQKASVFLRNRFIRIWPPYAIMTIVWVMLFSGGLNAFHQLETLKLILQSLAFIPISPHVPLYFDVTLPLGWTLEFEAYFYLIFGLALIFKRARWHILFIWFLSSVILYPYSSRGLNLDAATNLGYSWGYWNLATNAIILEFLGGVTVGLVYVSGFKINSVLACKVLITFGVAFSIYVCYGRIFDFHGPLKWGIPALTLLATLAISSKSINIYVPRPLVWLGGISYSLYLTHTTTQQLLVQLFKNNDFPTTNIGFIIVSTLITILVGYIFYIAVEVQLCGKVRKYFL